MGIRTPDLLIANETLYQLSYTPHLPKSFVATSEPQILCAGKSQGQADKPQLGKDHAKCAAKSAPTGKILVVRFSRPFDFRRDRRLHSAMRYISDADDNSAIAVAFGSVAPEIVSSGLPSANDRQLFDLFKVRPNKSATSAIDNTEESYVAIAHGWCSRMAIVSRC